MATIIHRPRNKSPEQAAREAEIRNLFEKSRPSLDNLVSSGEFLPPVTVGDYFDIAHVLAEMKALRQQSGLSLRQCAAISGLDYAALSRLENGVTPNPTVQTLARCIGALGKRLHITIEDVDVTPVTAAPPRIVIPKSVMAVEPIATPPCPFEVAQFGSFKMTTIPLSDVPMRMHVNYPSKQHVPLL